MWVWNFHSWHLEPNSGDCGPQSLCHKVHQLTYFIELGKCLATVRKKMTCLFFASYSFLVPNFVDLGLGHFRGFPTSGDLTPHLTHARYSPWEPDKNGFCSGGIGHHLGEIWAFEIFAVFVFFGTLTAIFSKTGRQIFTKFLQSTYRLAWSNLWKKIKNRFVGS